MGEITSELKTRTVSFLKVDVFLTGLSSQPLLVISVQKLLRVTLRKMLPNKTTAAANLKQIKKEGEADYLTVGGAAVTPWMPKSACAPCAGAKEGSGGEVSCPATPAGG